MFLVEDVLRIFRSIVWGLFLVGLLIPGTVQALDDSVGKKIEKPVEQAIVIRQGVQKQEEQWRQEKQQQLARYEQAQQEFQALQEHYQQLQQEHGVLQDKVAEKSAELEQMVQISAQLQPFLQDLLARLRSFCQRDLPFLVTERQQRLERLQESLDDGETPINEKLRKVMEALMVEADYGRTIEVTRETIVLSNQPTLVDIFRFGRLALYYQTLDEQSCGFFNIAEQQWQPLPATYTSDIRTAFEIGAKRRPVELVTLPLGRLVQP